MYYVQTADGYLEHHGILGMEWGKRRYQNKDGSLTAAGREHYGVGEAKKAKTMSSHLHPYQEYTSKNTQVGGKKTYNVQSTSKNAYDKMVSNRVKALNKEGGKLANKKLDLAIEANNRSIARPTMMQTGKMASPGSAYNLDGKRTRSGLLIYSGKEAFNAKVSEDKQRLSRIQNNSSTRRGQEELDKLLVEFSKDYNIVYHDHGGYTIEPTKEMYDRAHRREANTFYKKP